MEQLVEQKDDEVVVLDRIIQQYALSMFLNVISLEWVYPNPKLKRNTLDWKNCLTSSELHNQQGTLPSKPYFVRKQYTHPFPVIRCDVPTIRTIRAELHEVNVQTPYQEALSGSVESVIEGVAVFKLLKFKLESPTSTYSKKYEFRFTNEENGQLLCVSTPFEIFTHTSSAKRKGRADIQEIQPRNMVQETIPSRFDPAFLRIDAIYPQVGLIGSLNSVTILGNFPGVELTVHFGTMLATVIGTFQQTLMVTTAIHQKEEIVGVFVNGLQVGLFKFVSTIEQLNDEVKNQQPNNDCENHSHVHKTKKQKIATGSKNFYDEELPQLNMIQLSFAGNIDGAEQLIKNKEEKIIQEIIQETDKELRTPLHWAMLTDNNEMAKWLLKHGANINAGDIYLTTPLHIAAAHGNIDACKLLKDNNADLNAETVFEETPYDFALGSNSKETTTFFEDAQKEIVRRNIESLHLKSDPIEIQVIKNETIEEKKIKLSNTFEEVKRTVEETKSGDIEVTEDDVISFSDDDEYHQKSLLFSFQESKTVEETKSGDIGVTEDDVIPFSDDESHQKSLL